MNRFACTMVRSGLLALLLLFPTTGGAVHDTLEVGRFSVGSLEGWEARSFKGETDYRIVTNDGRRVLQAESRGSASGRYRRLKVDPREYPLLRWSWKVAGTVSGENARSKGGDDFAARVYVIFPGFFFWQSRSIAYVWSGSLKKGEAIPNAYTGRVMVVAVESGDLLAGKWVSEERNYLADYRRLFGEEPGSLGAVAVMTDSDNTGGQALAWYGDIGLVAGKEVGQ